MFHRYTKISFIFLCSNLVLAMNAPVGQPILTFNSAFDFAIAVRKAQDGRFGECFSGAACCATATSCCATAISLSPVLMFAADDPHAGWAEGLGLAGCLAGFCAANAGLVYGAYRLVTRSTDYNAAWRVVTYSCLRCLRENVLQDPNIAIRLNDDMRQAIIDAINHNACTGLCPAHSSPQVVY